MKELSIEEKARRYDDLLVKLQEAKVDNDVCDERYCCVIDDIVPELAESEGERMIQYFKDLASFDKAEELYKKYGFSHKDAIAWLEKKSEQKPAVIIPKFRVGDEIKTSNEESLTITKIDEKGYWSEDLFICGFDDTDNWKLVEQKPADKVEPKFKVGDVMRTLEEAADGFTDGMPVVVSIDDEDYHCTNERIAIKDQDEYEYPPMNRKQESAEWSEEDEKFVHGLIRGLAAKRDIHGHTTFSSDCIDITQTINWLKFLKDRYTWKPSDKHYELEEFARVVRGNLTGISKTVQKLFEAKYLQLTGRKMYIGFKD